MTSKGSSTMRLNTQQSKIDTAQHITAQHSPAQHRKIDRQHRYTDQHHSKIDISQGLVGLEMKVVKVTFLTHCFIDY
jgi:hypothetical protein